LFLGVGVEFIRPAIILCHFRCLYVIPAIIMSFPLSLCHSRESGNLYLIFIQGQKVGQPNMFTEGLELWGVGGAVPCALVKGIKNHPNGKPVIACDQDEELKLPNPLPF